MLLAKCASQALTATQQFLSSDPVAAIQAKYPTFKPEYLQLPAIPSSVGAMVFEDWCFEPNQNLLQLCISRQDLEGLELMHRNMSPELWNALINEQLSTAIQHLVSLCESSAGQLPAQLEYQASVSAMGDWLFSHGATVFSAVKIRLGGLVTATDVQRVGPLQSGELVQSRRVAALYRLFTATCSTAVFVSFFSHLTKEEIREVDARIASNRGSAAHILASSVCTHHSPHNAGCVADICR